MVSNVHRQYSFVSIETLKWKNSGIQTRVGDIVWFIMKESADYNKKLAEWRVAIVAEVQERKVTFEFSGRNDKAKRERLVRNPREIL